MNLLWAEWYVTYATRPRDRSLRVVNRITSSKDDKGRKPANGGIHYTWYFAEGDTFEEAVKNAALLETGGRHKVSQDKRSTIWVHGEDPDHKFGGGGVK